MPYYNSTLKDLYAYICITNFLVKTTIRIARGCQIRHWKPVKFAVLTLWRVFNLWALSNDFLNHISESMLWASKSHKSAEGLFDLLPLDFSCLFDEFSNIRDKFKLESGEISVPRIFKLLW